jgi:hypothetical protein
MRTPYVRHTFGEEVTRKLGAHINWLTAGVASSIGWPSGDVCIEYAEDEYFLRGSERDGKPSPPGITIQCNQNATDEGMAKVYRFTSVLTWFLGGYVDASGFIWNTRPTLYGDPRTVYSSMGVFGQKSFNCNHMPIIEDENVRKALAFWREGLRLQHVHPSYSFLSFYKVVESQFRGGKDKGKWIDANLDRLTGDAAKRVASLRKDGIDVGRHLFDSGRCAVTHATLEGEVIDPDVPADRRRLAGDLVIVEELARTYIRDVLQVPDSMSLHRSRDRLAPWYPLLPEAPLTELRAGKRSDFAALDGRPVSIGLWPDGSIPGMRHMIMQVVGVDDGMVKIAVVNPRNTILLYFVLDFRSGRIHTCLEEGGLRYGQNSPDEDDVRAYATFFYKVLGNGIAELACEGVEPVDCDVVIPVNILPPNPDEAIAQRLEEFHQKHAAEQAAKEGPAL